MVDTFNNGKKKGIFQILGVGKKRLSFLLLTTKKDVFYHATIQDNVSLYKVYTLRDSVYMCVSHVMLKWKNKIGIYTKW